MDKAESVFTCQGKSSRLSEPDAVVHYVPESRAQPISALICQRAMNRVSQLSAVGKCDIHKQIQIAKRIVLVVTKINEEIVALEGIPHLPFKIGGV